MKKIIASMFCVLAIVTSTDASDRSVDERQEKQQTTTISDNTRHITPVVVGRYYMGGVVDGKFLSDEDFYNNYWSYVRDMRYNVYADERYLGRATVYFSYMGAEFGFEDRPHHAHIDMISPTAESDSHIIFDFTLNADWDLFPRPYKEQDSRQPTYQRIVEGILRDEGIENIQTTIKQLLRVDLDGDGAEEVLIVAEVDRDYFAWSSEEGDHSIVILRKLTDGHVREQVVISDLAIEGKQRYSGTKTLYSLDSIADIDGDGVMEVVISGWSGGFYDLLLYQLKDGKLQLIASNGDGN